LAGDFGTSEVKVLANRHVKQGESWSAPEGAAETHKTSGPEPLSHELGLFLDACTKRTAPAVDVEAGVPALRVGGAAQPSPRGGGCCPKCSAVRRATLRPTVGTPANGLRGAAVGLLMRGLTAPSTLWHDRTRLAVRACADHLTAAGRGAMGKLRMWWPVAMTIAACLLAAVPAAAQAPRPEQRVALLIGNSAYPEAPLRNPVNDVRAMAQALRDLGFTVMLYENATKRTMETAIVEFGQRLADGGVGAFYCAGHGLQVRGHN